MVMEECGIGALTYLYLRASFCDAHLFSLAALLSLTILECVCVQGYKRIAEVNLKPASKGIAEISHYVMF